MALGDKEGRKGPVSSAAPPGVPHRPRAAPPGLRGGSRRTGRKRGCLWEAGEKFIRVPGT